MPAAASRWSPTRSRDCRRRRRKRPRRSPARSISCSAMRAVDHRGGRLAPGDRGDPPGVFGGRDSGRSRSRSRPPSCRAARPIPRDSSPVSPTAPRSTPIPRRATGTAAQRSTAPARKPPTPPSKLQTRFVMFLRQTEIGDRRRHDRLPCDLTVMLRHGRPTIEGQTVDLSEGGMLVRAPAPRSLPIGDDARLPISTRIGDNVARASSAARISACICKASRSSETQQRAAASQARGDPRGEQGVRRSRGRSGRAIVAALRESGLRRAADARGAVRH